MDLECVTNTGVAVSSPSSGRNGHLLPPGEKEKRSSVTASRGAPARSEWAWHDSLKIVRIVSMMTDALASAAL